MGLPIIAVAIQYRLNIFAFGDDDSSVNLALKDQALALQWVQRHVAAFGGDPVSDATVLNVIQLRAALKATHRKPLLLRGRVQEQFTATHTW